MTWAGPEPGLAYGLSGDNFGVSGTYWDRTLRSEQDILTDWLD